MKDLSLSFIYPDCSWKEIGLIINPSLITYCPGELVDYCIITQNPVFLKCTTKKNCHFVCFYWLKKEQKEKMWSLREMWNTEKTCLIHAIIKRTTAVSVTEYFNSDCNTTLRACRKKNTENQPPQQTTHCYDTFTNTYHNMSHTHQKLSLAFFTTSLKVIPGS